MEFSMVTFGTIIGTALGVMLILAKVIHTLVTKYMNNGKGKNHNSKKKKDDDLYGAINNLSSNLTALKIAIEIGFRDLQSTLKNLQDSFDRMSERSKENHAYMKDVFGSITDCNRIIKADLNSIKGSLIELKARFPAR